MVNVYCYITVTIGEINEKKRFLRLGVVGMLLSSKSEALKVGLFLAFRD